MSICIHPLLNEDTLLPFVVCGIGSQEMQCPISRKDGYPLHQLIFSRKGEGILQTNKVEYTVRTGDFLYLKPHESHYYASKGGTWSTDWILFQCYQADVILSALNLQSSICAHYSNQQKIMDQFYAIIAALQCSDYSSNIIASSQLYHLLALLHQNRLPEIQSDAQNENGMITPILQFIDSHFAQEISLESLAKLVGISPQHLCKVFKKNMKMRPFEYITKKRLQAAKKLLLETNMPVKSVARAIGYDDNNYFGILFKKHEGVTATHYRGNIK